MPAIIQIVGQILTDVFSKEGATCLQFRGLGIFSLERSINQKYKFLLSAENLLFLLKVFFFIQNIV
jgi:hypothetical protein